MSHRIALYFFPCSASRVIAPNHLFIYYTNTIEDYYYSINCITYLLTGAKARNSAIRSSVSIASGESPGKGIGDEKICSIHHMTKQLLLFYINLACMIDS